MATEAYLRRHFHRMGVRVYVSDLQDWQLQSQGRVKIDVRRDRDGEYFDIRRHEDLVAEVIDVRPAIRHMVLMIRDGKARNKYLLGHDERHWFAAAVPGESVRDVRTAIASLRPDEADGRSALRQGEWFFVPEPGFDDKGKVIHRHEPLSRGGGSKPHICKELIRHGGVTVMISSTHPVGISTDEHARLIAEDPKARLLYWRSMTRDAAVYVRGEVRHPDHRTIRLDGWHRVHMNRERFAPHADQIAFLD